MKDLTVRIDSVEINNMKNVVHGVLSLGNLRKTDFPVDILALYGQNGSGKSTLIEALGMLKMLMSGCAIPAVFADSVNLESETAQLKFVFSFKDVNFENAFWVTYCVSFKKEVIKNVNSESGHCVVRVFDEKLSVKYPEKKIEVLFDASASGVFGPVVKRKALLGTNSTNSDVYTDAVVAKKICRAESRSFLFSKELMKVISTNESAGDFVAMMQRLAFFAQRELFVISTRDMGIISLNALPINFKHSHDGGESIGTILLPLERSSLIPEAVYPDVIDVLNEMNIVLRELVPGLTIGLKNLGRELGRDGNTMVRVESVSFKNSKEIALRNESDGIKKIISVLNLLIGVYNLPNLTVAIDELDSGVFEYLLGQIVQIISERGQGQLIFTSHNLRPLETIDRGFIAFTTTNPDNRYIRLSNIKNTNNLRDVYFRDILLGGQKEELYDITRNQSIAFALRKAGGRHEA